MRLAARVCLATGVSDDPEQWLHEADDRKLAFWRAWYRLEPWGGDKEVLAAVATLITHLDRTLLACHGQRPSSRSLQIKDFMPLGWEGASPATSRKDQSSINAFYQFAQKFKK